MDKLRQDIDDIKQNTTPEFRALVKALIQKGVLTLQEIKNQM